MKVIRRPKDATASLEWQRERDQAVGRAIAAGFGTRPPQWWVFESDRPDLAADEGEDAYAHLRGEGPFMDRARERLRYLAATGELQASELAAIVAGEGECYQWRQRVLAKAGPR